MDCYVSLLVNLVLVVLIINRAFRMVNARSFSAPSFFKGSVYWVSKLAVFGSAISLALLQIRHFVPGAGILGLTFSIAFYLLAWAFVFSELRGLSWFGKFKL